MKRDGSQNFIAQDWQPQTALVRDDLARSLNQETCEALYLTSGFVYDTTEEAEAALKGGRQTLYLWKLWQSACSRF